MKRRRFLQGVGGAALAAPFLSSLQPRSAQAQAAAAPRRLVIFYTQNGCLVNRWFPKVEGAANGGSAPIDAAALAGGTLEKLTPFASKLLFPRGLAMFPKGTINGYFDPHDQGMGSKLTAAPIDPANSHYATSNSLDHTVAKLINAGANKAPLVLSVGNFFNNVKGILSYSAANTPFPPETKPANVYKSLATGFATGGAAPTMVDYKVKRGNSILDMVKGDLDGLKRLNMSVADTKKIDDWASLLRQVEIKVASAACTSENATTLGLTEASTKVSTTSTGTAFTTGGDLMINLIALTMMCDTNRSIILQWPGFVTFNWDGITHQYDHHGLSHRVGSAAVSGNCVDGVIEMIGQIDNWYAGRYAKLVGLIDSIKEGDKTMLDNSAVMWLPELGDGQAHNNTNLPIVIAGSAGGYLKQGVSVNLDTKVLGTGDSEAGCATPGQAVGFTRTGSGGNVPLNKLYVTLLNAVGAKNTDGSPITQFGTMDTSDVAKGITNPGELAAIKA